MGAAARPRLEARPGPAAAHGRSFFRSPPCLGGALGAIAGVFALRDETDSTFAGASLQWNETAITIAGDERPFSGQFQPAKVLAVSMGRAAWRAKVLAVSKLVRHRILCPTKFALQAHNGRKWLPVGALGEFFAEEPLQALIVNVSMCARSPCGGRSSAGEKGHMQFPSRFFKL